MSNRPIAGQPAPEFTLPTQVGETPVALADFRGKRAVVLYFYPKDDTPGCTTESCAFRDLAAEFADAGAVILGISRDDVASHQKFAQKFGLTFPLLSDEDGSVCADYGVWVEKNNYGKKYMGIERTTFAIDRNGAIAKVWPRVKVENHADEVLAFVKTL
jgi:peroxiredoxin Q/BCP